MQNNHVVYLETSYEGIIAPSVPDSLSQLVGSKEVHSRENTRGTVDTLL